MSKCLLCPNQAAEHHREPGGRDGLRYECPNCGTYFVARSAVKLLRDDPEIGRERWRLSGLVREATDEGRTIELDTENALRLARMASPPRDPVDAVDRLLLLIQRKTTQAGDVVPLDEGGASLYARNPREFRFLCEVAVQLGLIDRPGVKSSYRLTMDGWRRALEIRGRNPTSRQAFVAMSFSEEMTDAWEKGFRPALNGAGYDPQRMDRLQHNEKICDRILAEIRRSALVVADFTEHRAGVYFEAGFALGLGIPVVWTCRKDELCRTHLDTRQYNHVVWTDVADLEGSLRERVVATVPDPGSAATRPA